jgi:hypothetical protein
MQLPPRTDSTAVASPLQAESAAVSAKAASEDDKIEGLPEDPLGAREKAGSLAENDMGAEKLRPAVDEPTAEEDGSISGRQDESAAPGDSGGATAAGEGEGPSKVGAEEPGKLPAAVAAEQRAATAGGEIASTAGEERTPMAGGSVTPTAVEEMTPTAGEEMTPTAGEEMTPTAGEEMMPTAGEELTPTAGEEMTPTAGEEMTLTVGEEMTPMAGEEVTPMSAGEDGAATAEEAAEAPAKSLDGSPAEEHPSEIVDNQEGGVAEDVDTRGAEGMVGEGPGPGLAKRALEGFRVGRDLPIGTIVYIFVKPTRIYKIGGFHKKQAFLAEVLSDGTHRVVSSPPLSIA